MGCCDGRFHVAGRAFLTSKIHSLEGTTRDLKFKTGSAGPALSYPRSNSNLALVRGVIWWRLVALDVVLLRYGACGVLCIGIALDIGDG